MAMSSGSDQLVKEIKKLRRDVNELKTILVQMLSYMMKNQNIQYILEE